ncbi:MAG: ATP-binding protein [Armatimonadetes bacterium]|nr:ATP-binding protein [Armatimonadota bacterium]
MRKVAGELDAVPSKRLFLSIIADYDLKRALCELVDNGLDVWVRAGRTKAISIAVEIDPVQQTLTVTDNAGGLAKTELRYIVSPGQTGTEPTDETIGIFGVGTKRAVVALAQRVVIRTRFRKEGTYEVNITDEWLKDDSDWMLRYDEVDAIGEGTTIIELTKLRSPLTQDSITQVKDHFAATYAYFLSEDKVKIVVNGEQLKPRFFENWSYPPKFGPRRYLHTIDAGEYGAVRLEAIAGLASESSPATGEYGVYFYCNDRLIGRALKTYEVGFSKGFAGIPHPKISLTRIIVRLNGDARAMPWNSSKSDVDTKHPVFLALQAWLLQTVKDYASISRIWMGDWPDKVFKYKVGQILDVHLDDFPKVAKSYLPSMPRSRPRYAEKIESANKSVSQKKPWVRGLYEGISVADLILKTHLAQKNRFALISIDSTIEIAFKEYLVNESNTYYTDTQLLQIFAKRHLVVAEIKKYVSLSQDQERKLKYYNDIRNKLIHERASVSISDSDIEAFRKLVEGLLTKLFGIKF